MPIIVIIVLSKMLVLVLQLLLIMEELLGPADCKKSQQRLCHISTVISVLLLKLLFKAIST